MAVKGTIVTAYVREAKATPKPSPEASDHGTCLYAIHPFLPYNTIPTLVILLCMIWKADYVRCDPIGVREGIDHLVRRHPAVRRYITSTDDAL